MRQPSDNNFIEESMFDAVAMLAITRRICKILAEENALLQDMKIAHIHKFYADKIELISILENYKAILIQNPGLLQKIPTKILQQMQEESDKFAVLIEQNGKQIARAQEVHKLVMEAVRKTLEKNTRKSSGYNKNGIINAGLSNSYITPPISINEKI